MNERIKTDGRPEGCICEQFAYYDTTPVTEKYLCVVVKELTDDIFIITAYFTDKIKRGEILWKRK